jgi:uncharacterized repeat protein (TIGR04138 family)
MTDLQHITDDHECVHCGYNLRSLTFDHNCPECGRPVLESVRLVMKRMPPRTPQERKAWEDDAAQLRAAIKGSGYPPDAFVFVIGATRYAFLTKAVGASITARDVCDAVRDYARLRLGGAHAATLRLSDWKIFRSEDVGRIIFRMVETGRLRASPEDSPEQFNGLFTLETLFDP